ncbi:MAG: AAA family ATPase [Candidatus Pacebacteria bacterium]|nr:AAA family ATPase [Candidatus Paceibacterota bacterium]
MATLTIHNGPEAGQTFNLSDERVTIGRGPDCEVRLTESSISRQHAQLELQNGIWQVQDLGSQNGLFVDNQRVESADLTDQAEFRLGNIQIHFSSDGGARKGTVSDIPTQSTEKKDAAPKLRRKKDEAGEPELDDEFIEQVRKMAKLYPLIESQFARVIVGQRKVLEELLVAIAANGHCLMIGLPGLAKTLMVSTLSRILQLSFKRIQFTPDLMPSDILGTDVLDVDETSGAKSFRFIKGPVFTNMLLADEINRTPPKTQSALLESMQERQVTISNHRFPLPEPFFVLATQNPLEQEGTYPLPEAQLDRFMFNITVGYPDAAEEEEIVAQTTMTQNWDVEQALSAEELLILQATVRQLPVSRHVVKYATLLVRASRPEDAHAPEFIRDSVFCGAGPRAGQYLILGAKARAVMHGRLNVSCDDVRELALPVMRHRIFTNFTADSEGIGTDDLIKRLVKEIPEPGSDDYE